MSNSYPAPEYDQPGLERPRDADDLSVDGDEDSKRIQDEELTYWNQMRLDQQEQELIHWNQMRLDQRKSDERKNQIDKYNRGLGESFADFLYEELAIKKDLEIKGEVCDEKEPQIFQGSESGCLGRTKSEDMIMDEKVKVVGRGAKTEKEDIKARDSDSKLELGDLEKAKELAIAQELEEAKEWGQTKEIQKPEELGRRMTREIEPVLFKQQDSMDLMNAIGQKTSRANKNVEAETSMKHEDGEDIEHDRVRSLTYESDHYEEHEEQGITFAASIPGEPSSEITVADTESFQGDVESESGVTSQLPEAEIGREMQALKQGVNQEIRLLSLKRLAMLKCSDLPVIPQGKQEVKLLSLMRTKKI